MAIREIIDGLEYGGSAHKYYWDPSVNPNATIINGLPDCTTFAFGAVLEAGLPAPVSKIVAAGNWHNYLINGWIAKPYKGNEKTIKVGDILEWDGSKNHVAVVSEIGNEVKISGSFYTGIHGTSMYDGSYDKRTGINSLQELSDFFINKYQYRFFHFVPLSTENSWVHGEPDYILVSPLPLQPVDRNPNVDQVYVGISGLRVRTGPTTDSRVLGICPSGYFNLEEKVIGGTYTDRGVDDNVWYKIENYYIAAVAGVDIYPKKEEESIDHIEHYLKRLLDEIDSLKAENEELKKKLEAIKEIVC